MKYVVIKKSSLYASDLCLCLHVESAFLNIGILGPEILQEWLDARVSLHKLISQSLVLVLLDALLVERLFNVAKVDYTSACLLFEHIEYGL
jgi:hypothetical protein